MLKNVHLYRFKTQQEFFDQYGENWRYKIKNGWNDQMDKLFGKDYPYVMNKGYGNGILLSFNGWNISWDMLLPKIEKPSYKPRKLIRDI